MPAFRGAQIALAAAALAAGASMLLALPADAGVPAPTVSANPVAPGHPITVSGTGCTTKTTYTYGVDVAVLNSKSEQIATGFVSHSGISATGAWSATVDIPASTPVGSYSVASTCDQYNESFNYPAVTLQVANGTGTGISSTSGATVSLSSATATPGSSLTVAGGGFRAGEKVAVQLHSTVTTLVTLTATPSGTVTGTVTVPVGTVLGAHHIELVGETSGKTAEAALQVVATPAVAVSTAPLAATGTPTAELLLLAGSLVLLGGGALVGARQWDPAQRKGAHRVG